MNIITGGFDYAWIGPSASADPNFANGVWLEKLSKETTFDIKSDTFEASNGNDYFVQGNFELKIIAHDFDQFSAIKTLVENKTKCRAYLYGNQSICFTEAVTISLQTGLDGDVDKARSFTVTFKHVGLSTNIWWGGNLLSKNEALANSGFTNFSGATVTPVAPHASFTKASGLVVKVVQNNAGIQSNATVGTKCQLPVKPGMKFRVKCNSYLYGSGTAYSRRAFLRELDSAGANVAILLVTSSVLGDDDLNSSFTIDATTASMILRTAVLGSTSAMTAEFDNLMISYGSIDRAFSVE